MKECKSKYKFQITYEPFFLLPNLPPEGQEKGPNYSEQSEFGQRISKLGREVGIDFTFKCTKFPDTMPSQYAMEFALMKDPTGKLQNELQEALFYDYFTEGCYPDVKRVVSVATRFGINAQELTAFMNNPKNKEAIIKKADAYKGEGISSVPVFIFNGNKRLEGMQEVDTLKSFFDSLHP